MHKTKKLRKLAMESKKAGVLKELTRDRIMELSNY